MTSGTSLKNKPLTLDKPIGKSKSDVNLSTFAFLISEVVQYSHKRCSNLADFQIKMQEFGRSIGVRLLELTYYREKKDKRETKFIEQLNFIKKFVWKSIYGKEADSVERHATDSLIYYIIEKDPIINRFLPKDRIDYSCAYLNAGIIESILTESTFICTVDLVNDEGCVYYAITFDKSVILREKQTNETK